MTAKREMAYSNLIPIFQQQRKCPHIISTGKSLWKGSCTFNPCRRRCSHRLWRRIYWLCNISARVAGWRRCWVLIIFMAASITFALIQRPESRLFGCLTLKSAGIVLSFGFESLLCFLASFFSPATQLLTTFSRFTAELKPSFALLFCFRGKSCSALICSRRFWRLSWRFSSWDSGDFVFHSIHNCNNTSLDFKTSKTGTNQCTQTVWSTLKYIFCTVVHTSYSV